MPTLTQPIDRSPKATTRGPAHDVRIRELAEWRLRKSSYFALAHVSCHYGRGVLTLGGCVPTYYLKQIAQATVSGLDGVKAIENQIEVWMPEARRCQCS